MPKTEAPPRPKIGLPTPAQGQPPVQAQPIQPPAAQPPAGQQPAAPPPVQPQHPMVFQVGEMLKQLHRPELQQDPAAWEAFRQGIWMNLQTFLGQYAPGAQQALPTEPKKAP